MAEDKVFDVAEPGSSKPTTGSKPMVVGHKIMQDPSIKTPVAEESSPQTITPRSTKTIKPIAQTKAKDKASVPSPETETENKTEETEKVPEPEADTSEPAAEQAKAEPEEKHADTAADEAEVAAETEATADGAEAAPESAKEKQKAEESLVLQQDEKLQAMIKSKEYYAPITEASLSSFRVFFKTFVLVALFGIIALVLLIDAEILDLGVTLPFDFL